MADKVFRGGVILRVSKSENSNLHLYPNMSLKVSFSTIRFTGNHSDIWKH